MILSFADSMAFCQGRSIVLLVLISCPLSLTRTIRSTPWFCTDINALDLAIEMSQKLPSCPLGHAIEIDDVVYQSTTDGTCSSALLCTVNNKNSLAFACNGKQNCSVDIRHFRFQINSTCGATVRFFAKFHCSPMIYERKDYFCQSPNVRNQSRGDFYVNCEQNYRLHIKMALVGISIKPQGPLTRNRWQCDKDTYWVCNHYIPDAYRNICDNQLNRISSDHCLIRYNDRPLLRNCQHGSLSNFSLIDYACIPGESIFDGLPRFDICSNENQDKIALDRGFLHSPYYPDSMAKYLSCQKKFYIRRESRLRLFMLEKSMEYYHELNIRLTKTELNVVRRLEKNEYFDTNLTKAQDELVEIDLKTNYVGGGKFLLYFQIDSRISDYAPFVLENDRTPIDSHQRRKVLAKREWGVVIGSIVGFLLVLLLISIVVIFIRISKCRRAKSLKYMKNPNDAEVHQRSPISKTRPIKIEHPHLVLNATSSSAHRSTNLSSPSKIMSENISDRESLLKQGSSTNLENCYEEINEQQEIFTNLALGNSSEQNPYLESKPFETHRDHRENEARCRRGAPLATPEHDKHRLAHSLCDAPMASTETLDVGRNSNSNKRPRQAPPKVPPPRLDLTHPKPSAPPIHLLDQERDLPTHQRVAHLQQWNQRHPRV